MNLLCDLFMKVEKLEDKLCFRSWSGLFEILKI